MNGERILSIFVAAALVLGPLLLFVPEGEGLELRPDLNLSRAHASFWGEDAGDYSGYSVAGAGDVNGDGYDDILIGAYEDDDGGTSAGQTYLILGKASGWARDTDLSAASASFWGEDADDFSGRSVAGAGDVNGDGYDDILIGAYGDVDGGNMAGQTYLILGKASGWTRDTDLSAASASFWGEDAYDYSGYSVAGAGDVNGDGYDDILIGAWGDDDGGNMAGQTYLILGKASGWAMDTDLSAASASFWGEDAYDYSGYSVAGAGDVNGDGYDDILIGAVYDEDGGTSAGQTYLILGKASGWARDTGLSAASASFWGEDAWDYSGYSVAGAGDVNGDGYDDILIGAYGDDDGGNMAGQTYLILGKASGWAMDTDLSAASASFWGEDASDYSGYSVAGAGDVNGDGYDDILIGAYGDEDGGSAAGQTYLVLPNTPPPAPKNLKASLAQNQAQITLTWDAADSWAEPLECYRIYRSADGVNYDHLAFRTPSDRSYVDTNVSYGRTYCYMVVTDFDAGLAERGASTVSIVCDRDTDSDGIGDLADWDDDGDGYVDGQDAFPLNGAEWLDTDGDGTGNNADTDDDNDGILDVNDPEPRNPQNALQYHLNYLNTTLQTVQTTVNGFSSTLNTMNTNLNTLSSSVSSMQTSLTSLINNIDSDIATMSSQVRGDIAGLNGTLRADITAVRNGMTAMNASLQSNIDNVRTLVNDVSSDVSALDASMKAMNRSLAADIDAMEARLALDIEALGVALEAVNASLLAELAALDADIADFRSDLLDELGKLRASMDATNKTQTDNYKKLENLINGVNATTLADIKSAVAELDAETAQMGLNLNGRIDEFRATTIGRLENISKVMATVDDIKSLTTEVKTVQAGVNNVKAEQATTSKNVAALAPPSWLGVVLIIIVLMLAAVILMRGGKKGAAPASAAPPPAPPAGPKPLEPLPPPED
ncbi:MAG: hypothetical protein FJ149_10160 [Euryarchaeota archaeon]|nr:hypothetical protein [Euryarchaeota archaeon]